MAGSAVIGALRVNLGIDTAEFQNGLASAQVNIAKFAKVAAAAATTAGIAIAGALAAGIRKTIDEADELSKAAQKFGVPIDELSKLKYVADLSGVSMEGLGNGIRKLSQNMQDFANGGNSKAAQAFTALGISATNADGSLKSSTMVIGEIASRFENMEDGAQKTAIAMAIFGKSGADLIPILNSGKTGLAEMMAEADALGLTLDEKTGRAAEAFNDNLTRMDRIKDGLVLSITADLLPILEKLSEQFFNFANNETVVRASADGIIEVFKFVAQEAGQLAIIVNRLNTEFVGLKAAGTLALSGDFSGALKAYKDSQDASAKMRDDMKKTVNDLFDPNVIGQGQIQRRIEEAFGGSGKAAGEKFVANFDAATKTKRAKTDPLDSEAKRVLEATRTPLEKYQAQIAQLNTLLDAGKISQDTYNRAVIQAQEAWDKTERSTTAFRERMYALQEQTRAISDAWTQFGEGGRDIFEGLIDGTLTWKDALKSAIPMVKDLITNLLNANNPSGFGGGILGSILNGLTGLGGGSIGKGFGLNYFPPAPKFASGGTILPGGVGGIDSQLVQFHKSPNERVDITKPGQDLGTGGGYTDNRTYTIDARGAEQGVEQKIKSALEQYDRHILPDRVNQISNDPHARG